MKKKFTFLMAALMLLTSLTAPIGLWGQTRDEVVYKTSLFGSDYNSKGVSGYTDVVWYSETNEFRLDIVNANNNNNGWDYIKIGGKKGAYTGTLTTHDAIDEPVTKVVLTIDAIGFPSNLTSMKLYSSSDNTSWTEVGSFDKSTGAKTVNVNTPTANLYYKIEVVCTQASNNGVVTISRVDYYHNAGGTTLSDLAITGAPVALSFDLYNNADDQTVSFTTSSTGTVTVSESDYITTSITGNTITVTPIAVTPSVQIITVNQAADATYAAGSKTFTVTISDSTPPATYDFTDIDFTGWSQSYAEHTVTYYDAQVKFASASRQNSTITDQPVTKGSDVELKMTDGSKISEVKFVCTQWGSKAQTITLHYSTDEGTSYTSTGITSTNFVITKNNLPAGTNAVKITFSSTSNQVGITSATIVKVCKKSINGCGDSGKAGYYLIASPVASVTPTADNGFLANQYDLYSFDQSHAGEEWQNFKQGHFPNIVSGMGYLYANRGNVTLSFEGSPYNGNGEIDLDYTASVAFSGWNLIGNPYSVTAYLSDERPFYRMNDDGDEIVARDNSEKAIAPMEGIFVQAANADDAVTFTTTEPSKASNSSITLDIIGNNDNVIDRAIVNFDGNTLEKLMIDENNTKIYIPQNNTRYAVACGDAKGSMPVNFKAAETGKYNISVNTDGLDMDYLHLIDRLTGEDINLLLEDSYSFIASKQDPESRFILSFTANGYNNDADATFAYQNGSEIIVNGEGDLQIFDVTGRKVMTTKVNGVEIINGLNSGVYIIRVIGETQKTQKIVVR